MKHRYVSVIIGLFGFGIVLGGVLAWENQASAVLSFVMSASACQGVTGGLTDSFPGSATGVSTGEWECPFPDDRGNTYGLEHIEVSLINVHGYDDDYYDDVCAKACITEYSSFSSSCGGAVCSSSYATDFTLAVDDSALYYWEIGANQYDFPFVYLDVPDASGAPYNRVRGLGFGD